MSVRVLVFVIAVCIHDSFQRPSDAEDRDMKAAYKSGEIFEGFQSSPITLHQIKHKLKDSGIFDYTDPELSEIEKKELSKLFDAVEIMTTSRNRQPGNTQSMISALRIVERAVKKQLKERQISETLASKFHWENLSTLLHHKDTHQNVQKATEKIDSVPELDRQI